MTFLKKKNHPIFEIDDYTCLCCGSHESLTVDHVIPKSKGGYNSIGNYQTLCFKCNSDKSSNYGDYRYKRTKNQSDKVKLLYNLELKLRYGVNQ